MRTRIAVVARPRNGPVPGLIGALLAASVFGLPGAGASGPDIRMVEITGEGAACWSRWRGPSGQGRSGPGSGNSSRVLWADRIFLTTAENDGTRLSLVSFRRSDGEPGSVVCASRTS